MFDVGQKVVCINAARKAGLPDTGLRLNAIYTIREITHHQIQSGEGVLLEELKNPYCLQLDAEWPFDLTRFAPVKTTSIDVFLKMLEPTPESVA
jgi:hypothetical protein